MEILGRFWARVTATVPDLEPTVLLGTAAVAALLVLSPTLWRSTRHVVTIAHEGAHGVAALVSGRRLSGIRLHSDTSGLTVSAGRPTGPGHGAHLRGGLHRAGAVRAGCGRPARRPVTPSACSGRCWRSCAPAGADPQLVRPVVGAGRPAAWCSPPPGGCPRRGRPPSPRSRPGSCCWPRRARCWSCRAPAAGAAPPTPTPTSSPGSPAAGPGLGRLLPRRRRRRPGPGRAAGCSC